jgi:hypothetical protein
MASPVLVVRPGVTWQGREAADPNAPPNLLVDGAGDGLETDPAGDLLAIAPGVVWTGRAASDPDLEIDLAIDAVGDRLDIDS